VALCQMTLSTRSLSTTFNKAVVSAGRCPAGNSHSSAAGAFSTVRPIVSAVNSESIIFMLEELSFQSLLIVVEAFFGYNSPNLEQFVRTSEYM